MSGIYKVRVKKGDFELEVETSERDYVTNIFSQLRSLISNSTKLEAGDRLPEKAPSKKAGKPSLIDISKICDTIKLSKEMVKIKEHIVSQPSQLGRLLLAFKFAHQCGYSRIGTGDATRVLEHLGIGMSSANASKVIKKHPDLFAPGKAVKQGAVTPYNLTSEGKQAFAKILKGRRQEQ